MSTNLDNYDKYIPDDVLQEVSEYERKTVKSPQRRKGRFPSNEDIVKAIIAVTGGTLTRYNVEDLYDNVIEYLRSMGFDTSAVTEGRIERLVSSMLKRGALSEKLSKR